MFRTNGSEKKPDQWLLAVILERPQAMQQTSCLKRLGGCQQPCNNASSTLSRRAACVPSGPAVLSSAPAFGASNPAPEGRGALPARPPSCRPASPWERSAEQAPTIGFCKTWTWYRRVAADLHPEIQFGICNRLQPQWLQMERSLWCRRMGASALRASPSAALGCAWVTDEV